MTVSIFWLPTVVLLFLSVADLNNGVLAALSTCSVGRVSLSSLPKTTYTFGTHAYSVSFCTPDVPTASSLQNCGTTSYVQDNLVNNSACVNAYNNILTGLTQYTAGTETGVYFAVTTSDVSTIANVTIACDTTGSLSTAALANATTTNTSGTSVLNLRFLSYAGCSVSALFCSASTACSSSTKSCVNGICFQKSCATLTTLQSASYNTSATALTFQVADCTGTPLSGLNTSDFSVTIGGIDVTQEPYRGEVPTGFAVAAQTVPAITTLLLDQSSSVTSGSSQALLQQAAVTYVQTVAAANPSHYVALIAFDGSANPVVVQPYTTDSAAIISSINTKLPPSGLTDPSSTNLYGAVISAIQTANAQRFSFGPSNTSVLSTMIVFTDGYDTSGRSTSAAAISAASTYASTVSIVSIGVAATSDTSFLQSIATSGIYSFPSTSSLVSTFTDVANQVALKASSFYTKTLCVPVRTGQVVVAVSLNTSNGYVTSTPASITVNASQFAGGCTSTTVNALAQSTAVSTNSSSNTPTKVALGTSVTQVIAANGGFFFDVTQNQSQTSFGLTVSPTSLSVLYLTGSRCQLSPYCYDTITNGSTNIPAALGTTVHFMVLNPTSAAVTTTITIGSIVTTPVPGSTTTPAPTTATTAVPTTFAPFVFNVSQTINGDVDNDASWVFFGYGILLLLIGIAVVILRCCFVWTPERDPAASVPRGGPMSPYTRVPLQIGLDSGVYARTPSMGYGSPAAEGNRSVMQPQSLMMSPGPHGSYAAPSLGTGVSPYRAAPFRTQLPSGRSFYDPVMAEHLSGARWSPRRDQDDL